MAEVTSRSSKRRKPGALNDDEEDVIIIQPEMQPTDLDSVEEVDEEHCSICLQPFSDRAVIPACSHEFCFECLLVWTEQSRRCPLCSGQIGDYLIHNIRSKYDFSKHYLNPLRTSPRPESQLLVRPATGGRRRAPRRDVRWGRNERAERERAQREADALERAIEKRKWVYRNELYAKHVASNAYTRYRPFPTPAQFSANPDLISRATAFLRRELRVWDCLDVEFLTTFTISLMKSLDVRSESAVKLLAEFLDMDGDTRRNAEHFAHELYAYLRSPYRDLTMYDSMVQYDPPKHLSPPREMRRHRRWEEKSRSPSRSHSPSPGPSGYQTRSPSHTRTPHAAHPLSGNAPSRSPSEDTKSRRPIDDDWDQRDVPRSLQRQLSPGVKDVKGKGRAVEATHADIGGESDRFNGGGSVLDNPEHQHPVMPTVSGPMNPDRSSRIEDVARPAERPFARSDATQLRATDPASSSHRNVHPHGHEDNEKLVTHEGLSIRGAAKAARLAASAPTVLPRTLDDADHHISLNESREPSVPKISSREIMARTRARLARLKQDANLLASAGVDTRDPPRSTNNAPIDVTPASSVASDAASNSSNLAVAAGQSSSLSPSADALDPNISSSSRPEGAIHVQAAAARVKLLSRLEAEKRAHEDGQQPFSALDNQPPQTDDTEWVVVGSGPDSQMDENVMKAEHKTGLGPSHQRDNQLLENKLRTQALLRVRLAAAKKSLVERE